MQGHSTHRSPKGMAKIAAMIGQRPSKSYLDTKRNNQVNQLSMPDDMKIVICGLTRLVHTFICRMDRPTHLGATPTAFRHKLVCSFLQILCNQL